MYCYTLYTMKICKFQHFKSKDLLLFSIWYHCKWLWIRRCHLRLCGACDGFLFLLLFDFLVIIISSLIMLLMPHDSWLHLKSWISNNYLLCSNFRYTILYSTAHHVHLICFRRMEPRQDNKKFFLIYYFVYILSVSYIWHNLATVYFLRGEQTEWL